MAGTASEALGLLRAARGRFDGIVIDGDLPDKDGFALLSEIRKLFADLPAVLTVTEGDPRTIADQRAVRIEKPFSATMVINGLARFEQRH